MGLEHYAVLGAVALVVLATFGPRRGSIGAAAESLRSAVAPSRSAADLYLAAHRAAQSEGEKLAFERRARASAESVAADVEAKFAATVAPKDRPTTGQ